MNKESVNKIQYKNFIWVDISQHDQRDIKDVALEYQLNHFHINDSLESGHLPKIEKYSEYDFLIIPSLSQNIQKDATSIQEVSYKVAIFFKEDTLITIHRNQLVFSEFSAENFESSEELLIHIIFKIVETYPKFTNYLEDEIGLLEEAIFLNENSKISLKRLYFLKTQARTIKKLLQIFQEIVEQFNISKKHKISHRNIKDKLFKLTVRYDSIVENSNSLLNSYLSLNAQRSNDVMKLLTVFSAFFLPLTFIVGVYGMNFINMPELELKYGYFISLGAMAVISIFIYFWFKRKKFL